MIFSFPSRSIAAFSLVACTVALLAGCAEKNPKAPKFVVAKGKDVKITRADLDEAETEFLTRRGLNFSQIPAAQIPKLERQICEQLVMEKLLLKEGAKLKLPDLDKEADEFVAKARTRFKDDAQFEAELAKSKLTADKLKTEYRKSLIIREVFKANVPEPKEPAFADIEKFYKENAKKFEQPDSVRASHILVMIPQGSAPAVKAEKKKVIDAARARLVKGEDFAKVAMEVSEDRGSASQGGDLGFFRKGEMTPEFEKVAFTNKPGTLSPAFQTPFGWHIIKVAEFRPAQTLAIDQAQGQIVSYLKEQEKSRGAKLFVDKIQKDAGVTYNLPDKAPEPKPQPAPGSASAPGVPAAPAPENP
jgi:parvulin-like peptidyl-prolyl isomerase